MLPRAGWFRAWLAAIFASLARQGRSPLFLLPCFQLLLLLPHLY